MPSFSPATLLAAGEHALLVEVPDAAAAQLLYAHARDQGVDVTDLVPAARSVLFDGVPDVGALASLVSSWTVPAEPPAAGELVTLETVYDGEDLGAVAELWSMTTAEVVATHTATEFRVAFCGFSPGFAYCTGLPAGLSVPRRSDPRPRVPPGSVGLAGEFTGVYPRSSPGGWQLIGRTSAPLWDLRRDPPALLEPGTRVRFEAGS